MNEFDQNLIELNLEMSPTERLEAHQESLNLVFEIESARKTENEEPQ